MKITAILLTLATCSLFATETFSQVSKVNINARDISVKDVLREIEKQTDYLFIFNPEEINLERKTTVQVNDKMVKDVLANLFNQTEIVYAIEGSSIMLMKRPAVALQNLFTVTGTVTDEYGEPIIGANIMEKGTTNGTITNIDGKFTLNVQPNAVLLVTYIGYIAREVAVANKNDHTIILKEDAQSLEEVVIVGYGIQKKVNLTGAISQVDSKVFENRPITSAASALQGTLPGVFITPKNGNPNEAITFNVRGTTSINGGDPLVLIDGVESSMDLLNPNDIKSVTVLKDAAASSIYGVRAAFGVILVTTKSGETDKLKINYSGNFSWSKATVMPEFVDNSYTHAKFVNEALARESIAPLYNDTYFEAIKNYYENPTGKDYYIQDGQYNYVGHRDWVDMLIKDFSPRQTHNVSISGGTGKTTFYTSVGHTRQEGVLKINPDVYQRTNARLSVENQTYDWMKLGFKVAFNTSKMDEPHKYKDDIYHSVVFSSPLRGGEWYGDPNYPEYDKYIGSYFEDQGPDGYLKFGGRNIKKNTEILLSPSIDLYPMKNWSIHADFTYNKISKEEREHRKKIDKFITNKFLPTEGSSNNNSYKVLNSNREYSAFNAYTDYGFSINEKHKFNAKLGFNQEVTKYKQTIATRKNLLSQEVPSLSLGTGEQTVESTGYDWALRGGFARINYEYDSRYLLELNGRYDGTSRFPKNDRFVFLPSFSVGWRLSEENFMTFVKPLFDNIKIRGSYGELGNQLLTSADEWKGNTKYYPYIPFLSNELSSNYIFGTSKDIVINPAGLTPSSLTWEKSATINGGIDITMLSNRLDMSFDIYKRTTSDMLISQVFPELLGTTAPVSNSGTLETKGWELTVSWKDRIGRDFNYGVSVYVFDSQAEITKYDGPKSTVDKYYVGKKIGEIWGYETVGFFTDDDDVANSPSQSYISTGKWTAGDIKYKDRDGSGDINPKSNTVEDPGDRFVIGNETPRYNYGITLNASYKGIFANIFLQGVGKRDFYPTGQAFWPVATQYFNTQKWFVTDSWSEDNPNAYFAIPRARNTKNQIAQTKYLQDASYLRLKNLTVGYSFPKEWVQKIKLSNAQIYFSGENLWEHSKVKGPYDPEGISNKGAMYYPFQRTFSVGIDLTF